MPYPTGIALRELSKLSASDRRDSSLLWKKYAPQYLESLLIAGIFDTEAQIPQTKEEFDRWLLDYYGVPSTHEERAHKKRMRRLWAIGALFFFAGGYYYDRYRKRVPWLTIRTNVDITISRMMGDIEADCAALRDGRISLDEWNARMTSWIKRSHAAAGIVAAGGMDNMTDDMWRRIENAIFFQLEHLRNFSRDIANGLPLDGGVCRRMKMYVEAARGTYHHIESGLMASRGYTLYASKRTADESCGECIDEEARGFVPVGELKPIGSRECLSHCKCYYIYWNPETNATDERN